VIVPAVEQSLKVLLEGQSPEGGYVASPAYPTYNYVWLRDGSFCAYALGLHGQRESVAAFHRFIAEAVLRHRHLFETVVPATMPPTRYTLAGTLEDAGSEVWPNFQLDGYGTWLWALAQNDHQLTNREREAAELVTRYLKTEGASACYDCWEENPQWRHTSTLAAVIAGLRTAAYLLDDGEAAERADTMRTLLLDEHMFEGGFTKHNGTSAVDASLLWLAVPFDVIAATDPRMRRTAERVADELTGPTGGVRRYLGDTFYGGGEWILLTAWLGWYQAATGDADGARRKLDWIEAAFTPEGLLPEQLTTRPQDADMVAPWVAKWGPVATPLLWSHAMHLTLVSAIRPL
jgi:GH15 family glucan-1,4-alpha-glucosidase